MTSIDLKFERISMLFDIYGIKFLGVDTMRRKLFENAVEREKVKNDSSLEKLVEIQALALSNTYHTACFDIKQLQEVLGTGETYTYKLVKSGKIPSQTIGKRKIVPVSALAEFLVMGEKSLDKQDV